MGALLAAARIVDLGGSPAHAARVAALRERFEAATGPFAAEDPWFEERSRAFWADAVTRQGFGRVVEASLGPEEAGWLPMLDRAHRGLFRAEAGVLVDVWSGAELSPTDVDEGSRAELGAAAGQLFDARVVAAEAPLTVALLPGAVFHPRQATGAILEVLRAARGAALGTHDVLDRLLLMEHTLRSSSRVKVAYAYRAEALSMRLPAAPAPMRAEDKGSR